MIWHLRRKASSPAVDKKSTDVAPDRVCFISSDLSATTERGKSVKERSIMTNRAKLARREMLVRTITRAERTAIALLGTFIWVKFIVLGVLHVLN